MGSLHTGSEKLLEVRTGKVELVIKAKTQQAAVGDEGRVSGLRIYGSDVESVCIEPEGMTEEYGEHTGYAFHEYTTVPLFFEQTDYLVTIRSVCGENLEFKSNSNQVTASVSAPFENDLTQLAGVINFFNSVGYSDLIISAAGVTVLSLRIEVFPSKISYRRDYVDMMTDINNLVNESVLDFMKKTYRVFVPDHKRNEVPAVFFTILQAIYEKYMRAAKRIISVPHHKLVTEYNVVPQHKAKRTDSKTEKWLLKRPDTLQLQNNSIYVDKILAVSKNITYDTQENRLVKFMLRMTIKRIEDFSARYIRTTASPDQCILTGAKRMSNELQHILNNTFLSEVSDYNAMKSMSLVFGMAPGYRELYKYYLILQNGFTVGGDVFRMSVRDTALLYEYWCFIKLYSILRDKYKLKSPDIIKVDRKGVTVDLVKGKESKVEFVNTVTGESIILRYNKSESETPTISQRPDNILELSKNDSKNTYKYVFDAKYRIEANPDSAFYPDTKPGPKVDDINTMHRYRDAIVYENQESRFTFEKTMFGAYILFPYDNEEEYKNHRFYRSIEKVNIGGLPFLPSATKMVTDFLRDLVSDSSESAFERTTLPVGIEERIKEVNWNKRDVVIGLVPDKEHLELYLENRIYFTRKFNTSNLPLRYIALYEKGKGITYYGELADWRRAERNTLPGKSSHAGLYHVFEVIGWKKLPETIKPEEIGPAPLAYTNSFLLQNAKSYSDLRLRNEEEYRLFIELRRRTDVKIVTDEENTVAFECDGIKIMSRDGRIIIIKDDSIIASCTVAEFRKKPNYTFRMLMGSI